MVGAKERCECVRTVAERVWPNSTFSAAPSSPSMVVLLQKSGRRRERNEVVTRRSGISRRIPKRELVLLACNSSVNEMRNVFG